MFRAMAHHSYTEMTNILFTNFLRSQSEPQTFQDLHYRAYHAGLVRCPLDLANLLEEVDRSGLLRIDNQGRYSAARRQQ